MTAIISAMRSEIEALCAKLQDARHETVGGCDVWTGTIGGNDALCAVSGEGKVNAALCATAVLLRYKPDAVINLGVGGGVGKNLKKGDTVVSDRLVQYDFDASPLGYKPGQVCNFSEVFFEADAALRDRLLRAANAAGVQARAGVIATGDRFVSSSALAARLAKDFSADVVEMEGAAIAQVCAQFQTPFCAVRAISDGGDDGAFSDFGAFLDFAVKNSVRLVEAFFASAAR